MHEKAKNPWVMAAAIIAICAFVDDLPEPQYNTFHDPGASAMLSIIFGNALALVIRKRRIGLAVIIFFPALLLKFILQPAFWVHDAWFWDIGTLITAHAILGFLALRDIPFQIRCRSAVLGSVGVVVSLVVISFINVSTSYWLNLYFQLGAARLLIPLAFWYGVVRAEREYKEGVALP